MFGLSRYPRAHVFSCVKWKSDVFGVYFILRGLVWVVYNGVQAVHMSVYDGDKEIAPAVKEIPPLLSGFFEREISARWDMTAASNKRKCIAEPLISIEKVEAACLHHYSMLILFLRHIGGTFLNTHKVQY